MNMREEVQRGFVLKGIITKSLQVKKKTSEKRYKNTSSVQDKQKTTTPNNRGERGCVTKKVH